MTTLTRKGQVTIPKPIRDALQLQPSMAVEFTINATGEVVIHPARTLPSGRRRAADRFDAVRGKADIRCRTDELMKLLRRRLLLLVDREFLAAADPRCRATAAAFRRCNSSRPDG